LGLFKNKIDIVTFANLSLPRLWFNH